MNRRDYEAHVMLKETARLHSTVTPPRARAVANPPTIWQRIKRFFGG